jgi:hypothetical protein
MRSILAVLVLAAAALGGPDASAVKVVRVELADNAAGVTGASVSMGSGTVVGSAGGKSLVLTCWHICPDGDGLVAVRVGGKSYPAEWLGADDKLDLAALRVSAELPVAGLADRGAGAGAELRQWGYTGGGRTNPKKGAAGTVEPAEVGGKLYTVLIVRLPADFGDSGAGVFEGDKLVGVCMGKATGPAGTVALVVVLDDVKRFLRRWP